MTSIAEIGKTVVVVVDYQNDFCHEDGAIAQLGQPTEGARRILPRVRELIQVARSIRIPRVFVRVAHSEWTDTPAWMRRGAGGRILDTQKIPVAREGTWGADFYGFTPQADEFVITKHRYSAFAHTPLKLVLQARGAQDVLLAGVQTNVCILSTARDAVQEGFHPVVIEDCCATGTDVEQEIALKDVRARIGSVVSLDALKESWGS